MLLHTCCAICAIPILEDLKTRNINPTLYFFNPNIFPEGEYQKRLETAQKVAKLFDLKIIEEKYNHATWLNFISNRLPENPANYPENGGRCQPCLEFRLQKTAEFARENNFRTFATTLSASRFKDVKFINTFSQNLAEKLGLTYLAFAPENREKHFQAIQLAKKHNLHRQKYCGCEYTTPALNFANIIDGDPLRPKRGRLFGGANRKR